MSRANAAACTRSISSISERNSSLHAEIVSAMSVSALNVSLSSTEKFSLTPDATAIAFSDVALTASIFASVAFSILDSSVYTAPPETGFVEPEMTLWSTFSNVADTTPLSTVSPLPILTSPNSSLLASPTFEFFHISPSLTRISISSADFEISVTSTSDRSSIFRFATLDSMESIFPAVSSLKDSVSALRDDMSFLFSDRASLINSICTEVFPDRFSMFCLFCAIPSANPSVFWSVYSLASSLRLFISSVLASILSRSVFAVSSV